MQLLVNCRHLSVFRGAWPSIAEAFVPCKAWENLEELRHVSNVEPKMCGIGEELRAVAPSIISLLALL